MINFGNEKINQIVNDVTDLIFKLQEDMDIRIPVIAAVTLLISLSEGSSRSVSILAIYNPCLIFLHSLNFFSYQAASLVPTKTGYECDDTSVYGTCVEIVAKHSLKDILTNMCR